MCIFVIGDILRYDAVLFVFGNKKFAFLRVEASSRLALEVRKRRWAENHGCRTYREYRFQKEHVCFEARRVRYRPEKRSFVTRHCRRSLISFVLRFFQICGVQKTVPDVRVRPRPVQKTLRRLHGTQRLNERLRTACRLLPDVVRVTRQSRLDRVAFHPNVVCYYPSPRPPLYMHMFYINLNVRLPVRIRRCRLEIISVEKIVLRNGSGEFTTQNREIR